MTLLSWFAIPALILAGLAERGSRQPGRQRKKGVALPGSLAVFTGSILGHLSVNPFQRGSAPGAHSQGHPSCPPAQGTFLEQSLQSTPTLGCQGMWERVLCPVPSCPVPGSSPVVGCKHLRRIWCWFWGAVWGFLLHEGVHGAERDGNKSNAFPGPQ